MNGKKKIALVLSGGGMHGFAQIGALKVLEKHGIKPDLIVGSSVGALLGAALAAGKSTSEIEKAVMAENLVKLIQPTIGQGLVKGEKIAKFILRVINAHNFEDLQTHLIINATNISKAEEIIFEKGSMLTALTASISIPGMFAPVHHNGDLLVDGGFYDVLPVHLARKMDLIIAIDVSKLDYRINPNSGVLDIMKQSVANLQQRVTSLNLEAHKKSNHIILITPDVSRFSLFEYRTDKQKEMMQIGEETAIKILEDPKIKKLLNCNRKIIQLKIK
jgi:NTE family protein